MVIQAIGRDELREIDHHELLLRIYPVRRVVGPAPSELADGTRKAPGTEILRHGEAQAKTCTTGPRKRNLAQMIHRHQFNRFGGEDDFALRTVRLDLAREQDVPPYVVFNDSTLAAMVQHRPHTLEAFSNLSGVGEVKLQRYGEIFLDAIHLHEAESAP